MRVGFVCTNYNNSSFTREAVASLGDGVGACEFRIVVVDNDSTEDDVAALKRIPTEFPRVELVLSRENVGYFPGLNIGIDHLRKNFRGIDHIIIGNNDLVFPENFGPTLERRREVFERWAVVAPDLATADGVHQNPHVLYPIGRARRFIWDVYFQSYRAAALIRRLAKSTEAFTARTERSRGSQLYKTPGPIEWGFGACYILGPVFFRHYSRLWAPTFLMGEEFFLAEQVKSIGQRVYYDPDFFVLHHDHATTDRLPSRHHWEISRAAHRVYKQYLSMSPQERRAVVADAGGGRA